MSITIDIPPAMVQESREHVTVQGITLERMCLKDDAFAYCCEDGLAGWLVLASRWRRFWAK